MCCVIYDTLNAYAVVTYSNDSVYVIDIVSVMFYRILLMYMLLQVIVLSPACNNCNVYVVSYLWL